MAGATPNRASRAARWSLTAALVAMVSAVAGGCAILGTLAYKVMGPPPVEPRYVMPKAPTLVMVENAHSGSVNIPEADALARVLFDDLTEHQVAPMIEPSRVHDLRDANPVAFSKMTISDVARKLGAQQVLYVHVNRLHVDAPPGGDVVRMRVSVNVKVIDAVTAQAVWPETGEPEPYDYESPLERVTAGMSHAGLHQQVLRSAGQEIARWFYKYQPETMREENKDVKLR